METDTRCPAWADCAAVRLVTERSDALTIIEAEQLSSSEESRFARLEISSPIKSLLIKWNRLISVTLLFPLTIVPPHGLYFGKSLVFQFVFFLFFTRTKPHEHDAPSSILPYHPLVFHHPIPSSSPSSFPSLLLPRTPCLLCTVTFTSL
jgi:hypothetical protein